MNISILCAVFTSRPQSVRTHPSCSLIVRIALLHLLPSCENLFSMVLSFSIVKEIICRTCCCSLEKDVDMIGILLQMNEGHGNF